MGSFEAPKEQLQKPWVETPLVESSRLSKLAGCRIFLKLENVQPSGSFKSRAMGNLILSHITSSQNQHKRIHFFVSSGGNAGLAAVTAAKSLGYPCTVVLPTSTKPFMIKKLWMAGAFDVVSHGSTISAAGGFMREELMPEFVREVSKGEAAGGVVGIELPPFDDERIWEGVSSIVDELAYQLPPADDQGASGLPLDAIICSVGGGGLMNGLVEGLKRHHCPAPSSSWRSVDRSRAEANSPARKNVHIVATETDGTGSLALALKHKSLISLPAITSLATSLGCTRVAERTLQNAMSPPPGVEIHSTVLHDAEAAKGVLTLADEERILVELACGVCVEAAVGSGTGYKPSSGRKIKNDEDQPLSYLKQLVPGLEPESRVVIIVCGGSNVNVEMAAEWRGKIEEGWGKVEEEAVDEVESDRWVQIVEEKMKVGKPAAIEKEKILGNGMVNGMGVGMGRKMRRNTVVDSPKSSWIEVL
ncbi:hypothetical protein FQN54_006041 [Arachnomyces sp. PD_36]|nr:hypothetical protein FQN54_006041 [Arachnomyces sp. PD_36]